MYGTVYVYEVIRGLDEFIGGLGMIKTKYWSDGAHTYSKFGVEKKNFHLKFLRKVQFCCASLPLSYIAKCTICYTKKVLFVYYMYINPHIPYERMLQIYIYLAHLLLLPIKYMQFSMKCIPFDNVERAQPHELCVCTSRWWSGICCAIFTSEQSL